MVGTIAGIMMASFMNNGGGAWDNAKKMIEDGHCSDENGNVLGQEVTSPTRPPSSAIPSAIRSRTPPALPCTFW